MLGSSLDEALGIAACILDHFSNYSQSFLHLQFGWPRLPPVNIQSLPYFPVQRYFLKTTILSENKFIHSSKMCTLLILSPSSMASHNSLLKLLAKSSQCLLNWQFQLGLGLSFQPSSKTAFTRSVIEGAHHHYKCFH